jgi:O-glycosyl hydrolase
MLRIISSVIAPLETGVDSMSSWNNRKKTQAIAQMSTAGDTALSNITSGAGFSIVVLDALGTHLFGLQVKEQPKSLFHQPLDKKERRRGVRKGSG